MQNRRLDQYNAVGKVAFSGIPWSLLKRGDAPKGAAQVWASVQRRNFFGNVVFSGYQVLQAELNLPEPDVRKALGWLSENGFISVDRERGNVTVVIGNGNAVAPSEPQKCNRIDF